MKIRLTIGEKALTAKLSNSATARDFASLLPLTLKMNDLFQREKYAHLPRALSNGGTHTQTYALGDIAYWSPGPDVAVFYRHDGEVIPDPGIIVLGRVASGLETLKGRDALKVKFELIEPAEAGEAPRPQSRSETRR